MEQTNFLWMLTYDDNSVDFVTAINLRQIVDFYNTEHLTQIENLGVFQDIEYDTELVTDISNK